MPKIIGFTYDVKEDMPLKDGDPIDLNAEFDHQETVDFIKESIESIGHKVLPIGNVGNLLKMLPDLKVDIVLNICEGVNSRNREAQVPIILETFGIPYIGSDGLTMSLALDKIMSKKTFIADGIPTPRYIGIESPKDLINLDHMKFPMIVKMRYEGTSKGLSDKSVVYNDKELKKQAEFLFDTYKTPALIIEEMISGKEFTVPLIGNDSVEALPSVQVIVDKKYDLGDIIYTFDFVTYPGVEYICPAKIDEKLEMQMRDLAIRTYKAVDCRDFGRVDFRVDKNNKPYVLEINPLPSLSPEDAFNLSPQAAGYDYNKAIAKIIDAGLKRYGLA
ncbi:MAG: ATP-grasp domain-containing protein [Candidatus Omnitrophica bacterium]|nr:ATP-grasp domain-containing protein [Candidatus Omnitrophota bacterium]